MIEYKYTKWLYLVYFLFLPTSVFLFGLVLIMLMSTLDEKWVAFSVVLALWFWFNLYLVLKIIKSKIVISSDSLVIITPLRTLDIPLSRIVAYKSYSVEEHRVLWGGAIRQLFPLGGNQHWFEIHYKDFKGKKRFFREDLTNFVNSKELLRNLNNYLKK